jgi:hypothetical protein
MNDFSFKDASCINEVFSLYSFTKKENDLAWLTIEQRWNSTSGRFYPYAISHEIAATIKRKDKCQ